MTQSEAEPRQVLAQADQPRKRADALESILRGIRLGRRPLRLRDRIFSSGGGSAEELTRAETDELYDWCREKQNQFLAEAAALDATLRVEPDRFSHLDTWSSR